MVAAGAGTRETVDCAGTVEDDSLVLSGNGTAADASGVTRAADAGTLGSLLAASDGDASAVVVVNGTNQTGVAVGLDVRHIGSREGGTGKLADSFAAQAASGRNMLAALTAVTSRHETAGDGKAVRASQLGLDNDVGITAKNGGSGRGEALDDADLILVLGQVAVGSQSVGGVLAVLQGLNDNLVRSDVNKVRGDALGVGVLVAALDRGLKVLVDGGLGGIELGQVVLDEDGDGALRSNVLDSGSIGDADKGLAVADPATGELVVADGAAELVDELGGQIVVSDASMGLLGVEAQVALHGGKDLRMKLVSSLGGRTVGHGEDNGEEGQKVGELHCEDDVIFTKGEIEEERLSDDNEKGLPLLSR